MKPNGTTSSPAAEEASFPLALLPREASALRAPLPLMTKTATGTAADGAALADGEADDAANTADGDCDDSDGDNNVLSLFCTPSTE